MRTSVTLLAVLIAGCADSIDRGTSADAGARSNGGSSGALNGGAGGSSAMGGSSNVGAGGSSGSAAGGGAGGSGTPGSDSGSVPPPPVCKAGTSAGAVAKPTFVRNIPGETSWFASPVVADLDHDGKNELVAAYYSLS